MIHGTMGLKIYVFNFITKFLVTSYSVGDTNEYGAVVKKAYVHRGFKVSNPLYIL